MADAAEFQEALQGTTAAPACRWARHVVILLTGVLLCAGLVQLPTAPAAHADSPGSRAVDVAVDSVAPVAPKQDDTLTVSGTVTNNGKSTVSGAHVGLRVGPQINTRSDIDDVGDRSAFAPGTDGAEVGGNHSQKIDALAPGISRDFKLTVPVKDLQLSKDGVYQLGVTLSGQTADQPYERVLGIRRTLLPWQPSTAEGKKTQLTFLWPLVSATHLTARTEHDQQQTPIFPNDDLAAELAPGGRLQQLVALGKGLPITWVIDPDLLATVEAMTKSYTVSGPGGQTTRGRGQAVAKQWLSQLQDAVAGHQVVALPFGDPDIASLAHQGKDVSGTLSHLQSATELASTTVDTILGVKPRTDFAWPVDGAVDSSIVDVATSAGAHNVIARSDSLREPGSSPYAPTAARQIGGGNTAIVADARLSTAFQDEMVRGDDSSLAVQRFLAQSLMVNKQAPENERSIVVAPQRMPTASQAQAMAEALRGLSDGRWTQPLDLGDAARVQPDPSASQQVPGTGSYPDSLRAQELPTKAFEAIQETQGTLDSFKVILTSQDRVVTPFGSAIMREMSTSWRGNPRGAAEFRDAVQSYLHQLTRQVHLIKKSDATLSGRSATIPVTVQNELLQGVRGLRLVLTSSQPNRLKIDAWQPVEVAGGRSQSVKFETRANANGPVQVTARLYSDDGQPYGEPMTFTVHVTSITPMVLLVIAGGVLLLVLAGLRIYLQRKRAAAREAAGGGGEAEDGGDSGEDGGAGDGDPGQPGDPAAESGTRNGGPSGSGEKVER
ncbi:hypothetical protein BLA24_17885 [Streptomyces cinnamoneus]|uniref:Uncharacterized protein n=1 Tax=Streptomyces cinnamoneus TaxID=53446 RepID=A0A2G1XHF6_STRCJ|nr:DUF6049 family protein [Streptomyces cinnamoneus]PHQ50665.1 hypothetical protein BLA24_17885 [Streptomyces cinnamoneus]PPT14080.1 hypothetical protein CYQ11_15390 [Streptomyces cinnamoneus]